MTVAAVRSAFHTLEVSRIDRLTDDAVAITFDVPSALADTFDFHAGQSLTIRRVVDGMEHRRSYSICSAAGTAPRIGVRAIPDGVVSSWLVHDLRPGDEVEVAPPTGSFCADPALGGRHLCIAAGSGITPMLSIASTLLAPGGARRSAPDEAPEACGTSRTTSVTLLYGNRSTGSVMFAEELADLKDRYPSRFELVHVLSREPRDVELFSGRLDAARLRRLLTVLVPATEMDHIWLCGPFGLLEDARAVLDELGVDPAKVHVEHFYVDAPPPELRHPDRVVTGVTSAVTVVLDGRSTTTPMPRDITVLDSAQTTRSDLPFACKGGVCGTCRARLTGGEVDMLRNYALEPPEVEAGFVLTCQSYPVSDEVSVDFDA